MERANAATDVEPGGDLLDREDAVGLAAMVRRKEMSSLELLEMAIAKAERLNPALNFLAQRHYDHGRRAIASGLAEGPLTGVPMLLKDLDIFVEGEVTGHGSRLFAGARAGRTSELVRRYERAGLVIFGKTTTAELGLTPTTESLATGPTRNPWSPGRSAGGSSGGSAVAVAARVVPVAHATDSGGSIRIPSSCCGVFGLKPSRGRIPLGPGRTEHAAGMTVHHAITRSVRDCAALLDATHGPEPGSSYVAPPPMRPFLDEIGDDRPGLGIALHFAHEDGTPVDPECVAAARHAARLCEELGHRVELAAPPVNHQRLRSAIYAIVAAEVARQVDVQAKLAGEAHPLDLLEPLTRQLYEAGRRAAATDYLEATIAMQNAALAMSRFMQRHDVLLSPTLGTLPPALGVLGPQATDLDAYSEAVFRLLPFTTLMNQTGQPSMSVPLAQSASGIPIGVMFSARHGDEATLIRLASQLERIAGWAGRRPILP